MQGSKVKLFNRFANWLMGKVDKHKGKIEKYGYLGVFIFVAIPLPGTGVWTGSLIASVLGLKPAKAIPLVILGNCVAGFIMLMLSSIFSRAWFLGGVKLSFQGRRKPPFIFPQIFLKKARDASLPAVQQISVILNGD